MAKITIIPHSVVDLITNSSTMLYVKVDNVKLVKRILNEMFTEAGYPNEADDWYVESDGRGGVDVQGDEDQPKEIQEALDKFLAYFKPEETDVYQR